MIKTYYDRYIAGGVFIAALILYHSLNIQHWDLLKACNDLFFSADTNEVYLQIDHIYLNIDMMKHFISYLILYLLNKVGWLLGISKVWLFSSIGAFNIALSYLFFRKNGVTILLSSMLSILYLFSFGQVTVGIFPETYGVTITLVWIYLIMFYSATPKHEGMLGYEIRRLAYAAVLGSTHLPLAALYLIGRSSYFDRRASQFSFGCLIVGAISIAPYLAGIFARGSEEVFGYAGMYADLGHLVDLNAWKSTFINIFAVSIISPFPQLINEYYLPYPFSIGVINTLGIVTWLTLLGCSMATVTRNFRVEIFSNKDISVILAIISIFLFYLYLSPPSSALYGVTMLPFFLILLMSVSNTRTESLYLIGILILVPIVAYANIEALSSSIIPGYECKAWGVKSGLGVFL